MGSLLDNASRWLDNNLRIILGGGEGSANTTRYWDCAKPHCAWPDKVQEGFTPVSTCNKDGQTAAAPDAQSGKEPGGTAFVCTNQMPWKVSEELSYGFAAAKVGGKDAKAMCCTCYELTFPEEEALKGKTLKVQVTNTGDDVGPDHFDIMVSSFLPCVYVLTIRTSVSSFFFFIRCPAAALASWMHAQRNTAKHGARMREVLVQRSNATNFPTH
jgi:hypothetical protein